MKVEDANDLSMATKTCNLVAEYLDYITKSANGNDKAIWAAYTNKCVDAAPFTSPLSDALPNVTSVDATTILRQVPLVLMDIAGPVGSRIDLLSAIHRWKQGHLADQRVLHVLGPAMVAQLADKRSQVVKLACSVIRASCVQRYFCTPKDATPMEVPPASSCTSSSRDIALAWLTACLKQVHVTVGAIATEVHSAVAHLL